MLPNQLEQFGVTTLSGKAVSLKAHQTDIFEEQGVPLPTGSWQSARRVPVCIGDRTMYETTADSGNRREVRCLTVLCDRVAAFPVLINITFNIRIRELVHMRGSGSIRSPTKHHHMTGVSVQMLFQCVHLIDNV